MKEIYEVKGIFNKISNVSSRLAKEKILRDNKDNKLFIKCLKFLIDDNVVTGISTKKLNKDVSKSFITIENIEGLIKYLEFNNTGKDENISDVKCFITNQDNELHEFLELFVTKKLRLGMNAKVVNKIIPGLIPSFEVMLADSYDKNKSKITGKEDFILTTKLDGSRIIAIKHFDIISFYSRQGKVIQDLIEIEEVFKHLPNGIYDGELLAIGKFENSAEQYKETMKRSRINGTKVGLKMVCYDFIKSVNEFENGVDLTPCIERKNKLKEILSKYPNEFVKYLEPLYVGKDLSKINEFSQMAVVNGEEGIMLNVANAKWEGKRVKTLLKVKIFHEADVLVYDLFEGDGKFKGMLGGIKVKFLYNGIECNCECGSGFKQHEREYYWQHKGELLNNVVTIGYFELTTNQNNNQYSLRFPTWKNIIRNDKSSLCDTNID